MIETEPESDAGLLDTRRFQILSLDGGGYKGMFAAAILARLEEDLGVSVLDHFDLVIGTSTGAIIALGLGAGLTPAEIVDFYVERGAAIFARPRDEKLVWWRAFETEAEALEAAGLRQ